MFSLFLPTVTATTHHHHHRRPSPNSSVFSDCRQGYSGATQALALERCCPLGKCNNNNTTPNNNGTMFTHPDEQCLDGYSGALCLVCATNYVKQGTTCTECSGGAVFLNAFLSMIGFAVVVFIVLLGVFLCAPSRKNADRGSGIFGQVKIILAFMQILAAMPGVFDNVSKGFIRSVLRSKRTINQLSFLSFCPFSYFDRCLGHCRSSTLPFP